VISAYAGPADVTSFEDVGKVSETKTAKITYSDSEKELFALYDEVRQLRESNAATEDSLSKIFSKLRSTFNNDWLLVLELYELALSFNFAIQFELIEYLERLQENSEYQQLISNGLQLLNVKKEQV
jgi:phenylalanine-4-hydroxylase